ncbi:MAG: hypothetical protein CXX69_06075 [Candidatus Thalassarchaeum betae]|jgi:hypothetical protein|uniref:Uncharacterized protein n=1 Tax=Candidatus Thalassarchaeum betae TaxID=2599289 RepID=A0A2V3HPF5_9ARCH|nr:MAG: hypothetical protein CXX69_06075 [Candidatus Thalassoarchaea betae]PXF27027.1 MAG: hypothetical protein CXX70_01255 [Euryarchaeota archaeon]HIC50581.1 hypothetical protein [Candidatus Poseidoniales archaeon]HIM13936.1 hypothetical protein [Candidatus Poseidoniales archaeon]HIM93399.1 hypothetical protein [Candidatus Poseidoniales archaeon]
MADDTLPAPDAPVEERLLFLQENMVNFANQFSMPVVEVALVLSKYIRILLESLETAAARNGEELPEGLTEPWGTDVEGEAPRIDSFPLETLLGSLDEDRMDILDTLIRTILNETRLPFAPALTLLREWESMVRVQLANSSSPGQLFSPIDLPDGF